MVCPFFYSMKQETHETVWNTHDELAGGLRDKKRTNSDFLPVGKVPELDLNGPLLAETCP